MPSAARVWFKEPMSKTWVPAHRRLAGHDELRPGSNVTPMIGQMLPRHG
jgi:hypothetical protein